MAEEFLKVPITAATDEGPRLRILHLDVTRTGIAARFSNPGQWVKARVPGDKKDVTLALANAPGTSSFELLIQVTNPPDAEKPSDKLALLGVGQEVEITVPAGKGFAISGEKGRDILLFAGGSGISAIRSLLEWIVARRADFGRVILFFGARQVDDLAYRKSFETWKGSKVEVEPTLSRPADGSWEGRKGYVQLALADAKIDPARSSAFLAGSKTFNAAVREALTAQGVTRIFLNF